MFRCQNQLYNAHASTFTPNILFYWCSWLVLPFKPCINQIQSNHQKHDRRYSDLRGKKKKEEVIQGQNAEQECIDLDKQTEATLDNH